MDYSSVEALGAHVAVRQVRNFNIHEILDSGQCFRWEPLEGGLWRGIALGRELTLEQQGDTLILRNTTPGEFHRLWHGYFDFNRDYSEIRARLEQDPPTAEAVAFCPGMRVLRQDPWEALCSFIVSQNNNIPRIKGIIARLCEAFGEPLPGGGHAFPPPERLASLEKEDLAPLRAGFRAGYILDAAHKVASGQVPLQPLYSMEIDEARNCLMQIRGVGPKVAECALLYGLGRGECFPVDVWIARALEQFYPHGFPEHLSDVAGIAQQYIFHYIRRPA